MKLLSFLFWGIVTAVGSLILEILIPVYSFHSALNSLSLAFFASPVIEEILKLSVLGKNLSLEKTGGDNFKKALFFGAGFFSVELALNLARNDGAPTILPLIGVLLVHLITSGVIGYFLPQKTNFSYFRLQNLIIINIALHLSYNLAVFYYF